MGRKKERGRSVAITVAADPFLGFEPQACAILARGKETSVRHCVGASAPVCACVGGGGLFEPHPQHWEDLVTDDGKSRRYHQQYQSRIAVHLHILRLLVGRNSTVSDLTAPFRRPQLPFVNFSQLLPSHAAACRSRLPLPCSRPMPRGLCPGGFPPPEPTLHYPLLTGRLC